MTQLLDGSPKPPSEAWPLPSALQLTLPRAKPRSLLIGSGYRLAIVLRRLLGPRRALRLFLDAGWLLRRLAYETSSEIYGEAFHLACLGLSFDQLREIVPPGGTVLDVGCGTGRWCRTAAPIASTVVGIDYDAENIKKAKNLTSSKNVTYIVANATSELGQIIGGRKFDVALLVHLIEHIDDPDALLASLRPIASTLVVEVPDFEADPLNRVRFRIGSRFYQDADHVREYTDIVLLDQLERNGWKTQKLVTRAGCILARACSADVG